MDESPEASAREKMALRIAQADAEALRADLAFATGRFQSYFETKGHEAEQRIEDRYAEFYGDKTDLAGGDGGEGGGGEPGDSDATDGGDGADEPTEEGGSTPRG